MTDKKHVYTQCMDSFTSFVSLVYTILLVPIASSVIVTSILLIPYTFIQIAVALLEGIATTLVVIYLWYYLSGIRKGKQSIEANYYIWRCAFENCRSFEGYK